MGKSTRQMDMLHGKLFWKLVIFALPIALTSILQQLFNSADVAIVGRFAGSDALAAVGANVANVGIFINVIVGFSVGPNVLISNYIGRGRQKDIPDIVHTVIGTAIVGGLGLFVIGQALASAMLKITNTPEEVFSQAELYFRIYIICVPFITLYNFGAAILRSIGDTKRPLIIMIISGFLNVGLNLIFVIVLKMSVAGVALATLIANVFSAAVVLYLLIREEGMLHLDLRRIRIVPRYLKKICQMGAPAGLQSGLFSLSNIFVQTTINGFGPIAVAGSSAGLNFEYFTFAVSGAFAQASVTFTGQNFGAGNIDRCRKIFRITLLQGVLFTQVLCGIFTIGAPWFVSFYSTDEAVIAFALARMYRVMALEGLTGTYEVAAASMRSMGSYIAPAVLTFLGTVGFRLLWIATVFRLTGTYESLMLVYPASWVFTGIAVISAYLLMMKRMRKPTQL